MYTPEHAYTRGDQLAFTASDGTQESAEAIVTFSFIAIDDLPVGRMLAVSLTEDDESGVRIALGGSDVDSAFVTFVLTTLPSKGKLYTVDRTGRAATLISAPFVQFSVSSAHTRASLVRRVKCGMVLLTSMRYGTVVHTVSVHSQPGYTVRAVFGKIDLCLFVRQA